MPDASLEQVEAAMLDTWSGELVRAVGGAGVTELQERLITHAVTCRRLLLELDVLAYAFGSDRNTPKYRQPTAKVLLTMARALRELGLNHRDVARLDLGRRRRRAKVQ